MKSWVDLVHLCLLVPQASGGVIKLYQGGFVMAKAQRKRSLESGHCLASKFLMQLVPEQNANVQMQRESGLLA